MYMKIVARSYRGHKYFYKQASEAENSTSLSVLPPTWLPMKLGTPLSFRS